MNQVGINATDAILNTLLKTYCDKGNSDEVNYFDFCNDVDGPEQLFGVGRGYNHSFDYYPKNRPRPTGFDIKKDKPLDIEDVLAKIRQFCAENRLRLSEFFRDFDKLRSGFITKAQFRIGMNMGKIVLSSSEFNLLCEQYQGKMENQFRWMEFSDSIDEVFTKKHLERGLDVKLDDVRTQSFYGIAAPDSNDEKTVEMVRSNFRETVTRERLDAKSFFQDFDRHNCFKISP
jgi:hypothetical protein